MHHGKGEIATEFGGAGYQLRKRRILKNQHKIFLILSLIIACSDSLFVFINYSSSQKALQESYEKVGQQLKSAFATALSATETRMLQIATFISNDQRVQELFLAGKRAVEEEGGGPGREKAAKVRDALYSLIGPSRNKLAEQFNFRQLHFHLGPGSVSFLRGHKPNKFGDRMDEVRYTIVVCNAESIPTSGFETGRVISGIRGVSPVVTVDPATGKEIHIGALEAGTSFDTMLSFLKEHEDAQFAVLLTKRHMQQNIWPNFLEEIFNKRPPVDGFYIESTTSPDIQMIMEIADLEQLKGKSGTVSGHFHNTPYAITAFPLRDFTGKRNHNREDVGMVLAWRNVSKEEAAFYRSILVNIQFGTIGFILIELVLFLGIRATSRKLESLIERGKAELKQSNTSLKNELQQRERAEKEKEKLHIRLLQSQKLESVGQLAAGIAHEINTPLQYVESNVRFFAEAFQGAGDLIHRYDSLAADARQDRLESKAVTEIADSKEKVEWEYYAEEIPQALEQTGDGLSQVSRIIRALKEFSHPGTKEKTLTNINRIIENALTIASHEWKHFATIENNLDPAIPQIACLADEMGQVILNIVVNAAHAIAGKITDSSRDTAGVITVSSRRVGGFIEIRIEDSGTGVPKAIQDRIFEPFFTTKEVGRGSGQGLSIARDVVEVKHGGTITFESEEGVGTTFTVLLPIGLR